MMVGARLKAERKRKKITQQELGRLVGLHYKSISAYERDISEPDDKTKMLFAKYFEVSLDYLMGITDKRITLDRNNILILPDGFPEECRAEASNYVQYLAQKKFLSNNK